MNEDVLNDLIEYIEEQKGIEKSVDHYSSGSRYDFAIELVEAFMEQEENHGEK